MLSVIAMALESMLVIEDGYQPVVHELKGHAGELAVAERTRAAFDLRDSVGHLEQLTGILLMASAQALDLRGLDKAGPRSRSVVEEYRRTVPYLREDRLVQGDLVATVEALRRMANLGGREAGHAKATVEGAAVFQGQDPGNPGGMSLESAAGGSRAGGR